MNSPSHILSPFKFTSCSTPNSRQGINSLAHILSPLKWTKTFIQSSKDDFVYEAAILIEGRTIATGTRSQLT
jgi:hypothetical protein